MAGPPNATRLVLASASPRRRALLRLAGLEPEVRPTPVNEAVGPDESPATYVARVARTKAHAVRRDLGEVVIAADTTVVLDGAPLGKPDSDAHALRLLRALAGRSHEVVTGVAVLDGAGRLSELTVETRVVMTELDDEEIEAYVATGEPFGKAGGYAIQGRAAGFVERIEGSWTSVVGLPLAETRVLLRDAGVPVP